MSIELDTTTDRQQEVDRYNERMQMLKTELRGLMEDAPRLGLLVNVTAVSSPGETILVDVNIYDVHTRKVL